jgi:hypothetical protein
MNTTVTECHGCGEPVFVADVQHDDTGADLCRVCHAQGVPTIYESQCHKCGGAILTDEWTGGTPYFGTCECGGHWDGEWRISDEPHPAIWC